MHMDWNNFFTEEGQREVINGDGHAWTRRGGRQVEQELGFIVMDMEKLDTSISFTDIYRHEHL